MKTIIPELEAYRFWKSTCSGRLVPFSEFKQNLIDNGYVIVTIESEGNRYESKRQKS